MQGATHRRGGELAALASGVLMMRAGYVLDNIHPLIQFVAMYPFAQYGAKWGDLDHHRGSIPFQDAVSVAMHKVLHLTTGVRKRMKKGTLTYKLLGLFDAKHRSWQTHSDLTLILFLGLTVYLSGTANSGLNNQEALMRLIGTGFSLGVAAHIILDCLTPEGCWSVAGLFLKQFLGVKGVPTKFSFVPDKHYFATGGPWERKVNSVMKWVCYALLLWLMIEIFYGDPVSTLINPTIELMKETFSA